MQAPPFLIFLLFLALCAVPAAASIIPAEPEHARTLDGAWRFKLEQGAPTKAGHVPRRLGQRDPITTPETFEPFFRPEYQEAEGWNDLKVPGNWEMAGYSPATYDNPDNASGFYRLWFTVPAEWAGRVVKINFDGVQNGAEIWCNGRPVNVSEPSWGRPNYHESGWTAWQADITPVVKFGERNLLALRVTKNTKSVDLDTGDYFMLGGVNRTVTLFSVPRAHIEDLTVVTNVLKDGRARVKLALAVAGTEGKAREVVVHLGNEKPLRAKTDASGTVTITQTVEKPRLWSAEHPNLYPLAVTLLDEKGKPAETVTRRMGLREVSIKNGVLLVNGVPVKFTGMCRHEVYPTRGTAVGPDVWRKDLEGMKAANVNAVRTSHYPYGSGFYDLCDEMGFYVMDELPYCWCNTDDPALTPAFEQRARETIRRDKNHACVVVWAIGNENRQGRNNRIVADLVKHLDPTRPRLVSWRNADEYDVDFDDFHYLPPAEIAKRLADKKRRAKWPLISLESPNDWEVRNGADYGCLDPWAQVMKRSWDVVWPDDHMTGMFLWEWQDRAVADACPEKHFQYDAETGIQYVKTKGITDGYRHPRPEYYHVKMIYSPIVVDPKADTTSKPGSVVLNVQNRYSFTNLSELRANWRLQKGDRLLKMGTAHLALAPRTSGKVVLPIPADGWKMGPDTLQVDFDDPRGWNVVTYEFALKAPEPAPAMSTAMMKDMPFPAFNLITRTMEDNPYLWQTAIRHAAHLINVSTEPGGLKPNAPMEQVRAVQGDIVFDEAPTKVVGHVKAAFADNAFQYSVDWTGDKADLQEIGWVFQVPPQNDRLTWKREALWTWYPDTHLGRPTGTALRSTMDADNTNVEKPNSFDYNSTKYDCDWAALIGPRGHGLRVEFAPENRHQVRGGVAANGDALLYVNRLVCPPRDLSSNVVPDLYTELTPGTHLEGRFRVGSQ